MEDCMIGKTFIDFGTVASVMVCQSSGVRPFFYKHRPCLCVLHFSDKVVLKI